MNFRFTAILFAAVVLGISVLALVTYFDTGTAGRDGLVAPFTKTGLNESTVDTVEIVRSQPTEERLVFSKIGDGKWELRQPVIAKVDSFAVDSIIKMLFNAKATRYPGLTDNLAAHGLGKPTIKITLKRGTDTSATINIGDTTIGGKNAFTFVTTADNPDRPIALRTVDLRALFRESAAGKDGEAWTLSKWLTDYRSRRLLGENVTSAGNAESGIESVSLKRGSGAFKLSRSPEGNWKFDEPANFGEADAAGDTIVRPDLFTSVRTLLVLLVTLQPTSEADYLEGQTEADWIKFGLAENDSAVIRVDLKPKGSAMETLLIGKKVLGKDGQPVVPTKVYCRLLGDSAVIQVASDRIDALANTIANPAELRNKDLLAESKKEQIDAIDIIQGTTSYKLRRISSGASPQWAIYGPTPDGRWATYVGSTDPSDPRASVSKLLEALTKPRAAKAVLAPASPDAVIAPADVRATVKIWYNGLPASTQITDDTVPPEPAVKGDAAVTFTLGKSDADAAILKRVTPSGTADFQIPLELAARLLRPKMDYVDPRTGTFAFTEATKLAFNRGAEGYELVRGAAPDRRWEFAKPDSRKGNSADNETTLQILQALAAQQLAKLVSDTPTAEELARWGLVTPRLNATVSPAKGPDRVYAFGNETDDKKSVYFRVADKPFVFTVPKELYDQVAVADLRDRTIFRFEAAKIKRLEIVAWKNVDPKGVPFSCKLERQGTTWVATEPKDFPLDPAKLQGLLKALEAPRASEFIAHGPDMGLDVESGAFQILIVPESGMAAQLRIGKGDAKTVFAAGSSFDGVAKLDAAVFKLFVEQPGSLRK